MTDNVHYLAMRVLYMLKHLIAHFTYVQLIVGQLYFSKAFLKKACRENQKALREVLKGSCSHRVHAAEDQDLSLVMRTIKLQHRPDCSGLPGVLQCRRQGRLAL